MGSDRDTRTIFPQLWISIHAPRVGSDLGQMRGAVSVTISIHAPRVGSDTKVLTIKDIESIFQSTLPVWGATVNSLYPSMMHSISIHAPRVGSDICKPKHRTRPREFQSTLPVWGATCTGIPHWLISLYFNPRSPCGERQSWP